MDHLSRGPIYFFLFNQSFLCILRLRVVSNSTACAGGESERQGLVSCEVKLGDAMTLLDRDDEISVSFGAASTTAVAPCAKGKPSAIIVSDVFLYRDGVAAGIAQLGEVNIVTVCGMADAIDTIAQHHPDMVIIDMSRPSSLLLSRQITGLQFSMPIVGFGVGNNDEALACAEAGIVAFVGADGTIVDLNRTVLLALEGKVECSPALTAKLVQRLAALAKNAANSPAALTQREQEIAFLVNTGLSNKQIASSLKISPATVKNHVHMILEKLDIHRRDAIGRRLASTVN
jgi:two-component system, NarL family, nitrate/nitrite response regulator NarL